MAPALPYPMMAHLFWPPRKIMRNPAIIRTTRAPHSIPPQVVKSHLVWKAKRVRARVTAAQLPTAIRTASVW